MSRRKASRDKAVAHGTKSLTSSGNNHYTSTSEAGGGVTSSRRPEPTVASSLKPLEAGYNEVIAKYVLNIPAQRSSLNFGIY